MGVSRRWAIFFLAFGVFELGSGLLRGRLFDLAYGAFLVVYGLLALFPERAPAMLSRSLDDRPLLLAALLLLAMVVPAALMTIDLIAEHRR